MATKAADELVVTELPEKGPVSDAAVSAKDGATDIESILGDDLLGEDPEAGDEAQTAAETDPLAESDAEDVVDDGDGATNGSPENLKGGQFAPDTAKVKLEDGTVITVADLRRNNLFQRDYSKKTEEVAREREVITKEKADVAQVSQKISEEREFLIWFAEQHIPKKPDFPTVGYDQDPMAHLKYQADKQGYDQMVESWRAFKNGQAQDEQRKAGETQQQAQQRAQKEVQTLFEKVPMLKDNKKAKSFFDALAQGGAEYYGLTEDEIATAAKQDHRNILALADALRFRRAKSQAPAVQKELAAKPKLVRGTTQRSGPNANAQRLRAVSSERLKQTGSLRDGIAAIEALIS